MITCPNCSARQLDGTIFCLECGASLIDAGPLEPTRQLAMGASGRDEKAITSGLAGTAQDDTGPLVTLIVVGSRCAIDVDLSDEVLVGRADPTRGVMPDIDLGQFGGYDAGVSRRHAILSYKDGAYLVEDLGSANGTFVNGRQIEPERAIKLRHGDEIMCGTLLLRIELRGNQQ